MASRSSARPEACAYDVFVRREGRRWAWSVLCVGPGGSTLLADYSGTAWSEAGADRRAQAAVKRDALARREAA